MRHLLLILISFMFLPGAQAQLWSEKSKLLASDMDKAKLFGVSVAIDGNFAIIGAAYGYLGSISPPPTSPEPGSAYIFEKDNNGDWIQVQKLFPSDGQPYDLFGISVDIYGDIAVVGAEEEDEDSAGENRISNAGSAYIFERNATGQWNQVQKIVASSRLLNGSFGRKVGVYSNYMLVGSVSLGLNPSQAFMFERDATGFWREIQKIIPSDGRSGDLFGEGLTLGNDYAVLGSPYKQGVGVNLIRSGSVYIFQKAPNGTWHQIQKIEASDRGYSHEFGSVVSFDGIRILIGARGNDKDVAGGNLLLRAGAAYVFEKDNVGVWVEVQKMVATDREPNDHFGLGVAIDGDQFVVGAANEEQGTLGSQPFFKSGSAYIFKRDMNGVWNETQKIAASDRGAVEYFAAAVAIQGNTIIAGAPYKEEVDAIGDTITDAGSIFIYELATNLSIAQNDFGSSLKAYPNPTTGNLTIELGKAYTDIQVRVMNLAGQTIQSQIVNFSDQIETKVIGPKGLYVIHIQTFEGKNAVLKVIKN